MMDKQQLEQWLGDLDSRSIALPEIAEILHVVLDASRSPLALAKAEELRTLRFAFAVLRDVFPRDADIRAWLSRATPLMGGKSPASLLALSRVDAFCDLAVAEWNRPRASAPAQYHGIFGEHTVPLGGNRL